MGPPISYLRTASRLCNMVVPWVYTRLPAWFIRPRLTSSIRFPGFVLQWSEFSCPIHFLFALQGYPVIQTSASSAHSDYSSYLPVNPQPVAYTSQNITSYTAQTVPIQNIPIQNVSVQNAPIQNLQVTAEAPIVEPKKPAPPKFKVRARPFSQR